MKSPGPANTDPSSTAGYPAALYNTVSGGGVVYGINILIILCTLQLYYIGCMQLHGPPKTTGLEYIPLLLL